MSRERHRRCAHHPILILLFMMLMPSSTLSSTKHSRNGVRRIQGSKNRVHKRSGLGVGSRISQQIRAGSTRPSLGRLVPNLFSRHEAPEFDSEPLLEACFTIFFENMLGFLMSVKTENQLHTDILGIGAFVLSAAPPSLWRRPLPLRVKLSCTAIILWGSRLGAFLFFRLLLRGGMDERLTRMFETFGGCVTFWTTSLVWCFLCSIPHLLGITSSLPGNKLSLFVGFLMCITGIVMEALADQQKLIFKAEHPGKFCSVGLWSISQHPNWFGDILLWTGIFVMNAPALVEPVQRNASFSKKITRYKRLLVAMLSPWFVWKIFYGQATGTLSTAAELAARKYGKDPFYQEYIRSVPLIVPDLHEHLWLPMLSFLSDMWEEICSGVEAKRLIFLGEQNYS